MRKAYIVTILICQLILVYAHILYAEEKKLNLLGQEICPNSAGALLRDELSGMGKEDSLIVVIEKDRKDIIQTAIKLEKLPVTYEEKDEKNITTFILKLR